MRFLQKLLESYIFAAGLGSDELEACLPFRGCKKKRRFGKLRLYILPRTRDKAKERSKKLKRCRNFREEERDMIDA